MILKHTVIVILVSMLVSSCYKISGPEKPNNLISKDKMVNILIDLRIMSAATGKNQNILFENGIESYNYIYNKYDIDSLQFALSNSYYAFYLNEYDEIYDRVKDSMESLKKEFEAIKEIEIKEKTEKDSLELIAKRDSLQINPAIDSLSLKKRRDSLRLKINKLGDERIIEPLSDTDLPIP